MLRKLAIAACEKCESLHCRNMQRQVVDELSKTVNDRTMNTKNAHSPGPWEQAVVAQIGAERAARGMPVKELAERVGIHPGSMPRYMKGQRGLDLALVERFAAALEIDIGVLLARANERQGQSGRPHLKVVGDGLDD